MLVTENCASKYAVSDVLLYCVRLAIDGLEFLFIGAIPLCSSNICIKVKVKFSHYRPGVAQRVGRGILFHDRGTRMGCVIRSTPQLHFTPRKDPVYILQETGWAPGPVWTGGKYMYITV